MPRSSRAAPIAFLLLAVLLAGCAETEARRPAPVEEARETAGEPAAAEGPLNVLVIRVDDLGWRDLSVTGSSLYETPHIDQLAAEGLRFTQAYVAHPRCTPSRLGFFTGRFPARSRNPGGGKGYQPGEISLAHAFREAGYRTILVGKWHLARGGVTPEKAGFEVSIGGGQSGAAGSHFHPYNMPGRPKHRFLPGLEGGKEGEYLTDRLTDETIALLRESAGRPFLAVLSHYAVHTPREAKAGPIRRYERKIRRMDHGDGPEYLPEGTGRRKMRQDHAVYAAMVESLDENVGRLLEALEELGLARNTVVVFTSDNGGLSNDGTKERELTTSHAPLRGGKGWLYEGGILVPTIVRWPGVTPEGAVTDSVIVQTDLFPTLLEIAGLPLRPEDHLDGRSFAEVLRGGEARERDPIFWHSPRAKPESTGDTKCSAVRVGDYKLLEWFEEGRVELYDLAADPEERKDLSEAEPERRDELRQMLVEWRRAIDARM
jgi:arylsulfatase A-like enzyme